jgi:hypothetical protein
VKPKRNKYHNRKVYLTIPDGYVVGDDHDGPKRKIADSQKEWRRYLQLQTWQDAGLISGLQWQQVVFALHAKGGEVICRYKPDAVYICRGVRIVEDVKGRLTELYKLKRKWLLAEYGVRIHEV